MPVTESAVSKDYPGGYLTKLIIGHFLESPIAPNKTLYTYHQPFSCIPSLSLALFRNPVCVWERGGACIPVRLPQHACGGNLWDSILFSTMWVPGDWTLMYMDRFLFSWQKLASTDEKAHEYLKNVISWPTRPSPWPRLSTITVGPLVTTHS